VLVAGATRATFLPVMWPRLGDARTFLEELKRKAGLRRRHWSDDVELYRYTVETYVDRHEDGDATEIARAASEVAPT
jgi:AMMECR1 domain-containing protein